MANLEMSTDAQATEPQETFSLPAAQDRFDQMYGRMKNTMDYPDLHTFNLYEDLRTRLQGSVTVVGEIVKSDPELWSDDR